MNGTTMRKKKGNRGSMKKANITLCNLPSLSLDEPFFQSIHLFIRGLLILGRSKGTGNISRWSQTKAQDTGDRTLDVKPEKNQRGGSMKRRLRPYCYFLYSCESQAQLLFICAHGSNLSDRQTDRQRRERTQDNGQWIMDKRADIIMAKHKNTSNAWIWHSKRLAKKKKVVQFELFDFALRSFFQESIT